VAAWAIDSKTNVTRQARSKWADLLGRKDSGMGTE
jgi:hypothetical protein